MERIKLSLLIVGVFRLKSCFMVPQQEFLIRLTLIQYELSVSLRHLALLQLSLKVLSKVFFELAPLMTFAVYVYDLLVFPPCLPRFRFNRRIFEQFLFFSDPVIYRLQQFEVLL